MQCRWLQQQQRQRDLPDTHAWQHAAAAGAVRPPRRDTLLAPMRAPTCVQSCGLARGQRFILNWYMRNSSLLKQGLSMSNVTSACAEALDAAILLYCVCDAATARFLCEIGLLHGRRHGSLLKTGFWRAGQQTPSHQGSSRVDHQTRE